MAYITNQVQIATLTKLLSNHDPQFVYQNPFEWLNEDMVMTWRPVKLESREYYRYGQSEILPATKDCADFCLERYEYREYFIHIGKTVSVKTRTRLGRVEKIKCNR